MARKKRNSIEVLDGFHVVKMGEMEIWDGADLALLRETLARIVDRENHESMGVDMTFVKYIPSGFFGMLYDYTERGIAIRLYNPQPHVRLMLWFREFFDDLGGEVFELKQRTQTSRSMVPPATPARAPWANDSTQDAVSVPMPISQPASMAQ